MSLSLFFYVTGFEFLIKWIEIPLFFLMFERCLGQLECHVTCYGPYIDVSDELGNDWFMNNKGQQRKLLK